MMTDIPIEQRTLAAVQLFGLQLLALAPDRHTIRANCEITLEASDGSLHGPSVTVFMSLPCDPRSPIADAETALLARAHAVLARLAAFPLREIEARFASGPRTAAPPDAGPSP